MRSPSKFEGGKSHFSDAATTIVSDYLKWRYKLVKANLNIIVQTGT
jgi:hypothetical protein